MLQEGQCTGGGRIYRHPFKTILESNFTSSKTFLSPFWVRAEHSTYLTARSSLASFSPISRLSGFCLFFAEHRSDNNQLCHCAAGGISIVNPLQQVAKNGFLPLLNVAWQMHGTREQYRTTEMRSSLFFMMFISFAVRSTDPHNHGCKTTICWFW